MRSVKVTVPGDAGPKRWELRLTGPWRRPRLRSMERILETAEWVPIELADGLGGFALALVIALAAVTFIVLVLPILVHLAELVLISLVVVVVIGYRVVLRKAWGIGAFHLDAERPVRLWASPTYRLARKAMRQLMERLPAGIENPDPEVAVPIDLAGSPN